MSTTADEATTDLFTGDLLAPHGENTTATEGRPFPPAPHIDLGDGYTQPPFPGM